MKAAVYTQYGPPNVLQIREVNKPTPKSNEILIKIHTSSVTTGDARMRRADPFMVRFFNGLFKPRKITILGNEYAGVVESVGKDVKRFKPGDKVFGCRFQLGSNAEYICMPEDGAVVIKPETISFLEAAVIPFGSITALHFLQKGNIRAGQQVLIYGASGSLGTAAIQIAKIYGAEVTGICSTRNIELVNSLGADHVIDYTKEDFTKSQHAYDIIFDTIGKSPFGGSVRKLKKNGKFLRAVHMDLIPLLSGMWVNMTSSKKIIGGIALEKKEYLEQLKAWIEAGQLKPVIGQQFSLEQIADAHALVDTGHKIGNVAIAVT